MNDTNKPTSERHFPGDLGQRRIDQLLKVHLFIFHVEKWLTGAQRCFTESQWPKRFVSIERFHIQIAQGMRNILSREKGALAVAHALQRFLQDLRNPIFDIAGEILRHVVVEVGNTN